jgi:hypothetical protein
MGIPATIGQYLSVNLTYTEPQVIVLNSPADPGLADVCSRGNQPVLTVEIISPSPSTFGSPSLEISGWITSGTLQNGNVGWQKFFMRTNGFAWTWTPSGLNGLGGASYCYYSLLTNSGQIACRTYFYYTDIAQPNPNTNLPVAIRSDYSLDSTIYYNTATTNTFYPTTTDLRKYVMPDFSDWPGITFPDSLNNTVLKSGGNFSADTIVESGSLVQLGAAAATYTVDTTQSTLGGYALSASSLATVDTTAEASAQSLILVFGDIGQISIDTEQSQTVTVLQDLTNMNQQLISITSCAPIAQLSINFNQLTLTTDSDLSPLMGLARYGQSLMEGDGFLLSDGFVVSLDDYYIVRLAPETRQFSVSTEPRTYPTDPETRINKNLPEMAYYLVEPETRTYKISANLAQQQERRTRRLEQ